MHITENARGASTVPIPKLKAYLLRKSKNRAYLETISKAWLRYVCKETQVFTGKKQKSTAPGIPRRSPIQVLTGPDVA